MKLAKGHAIASLITFGDTNNYSGNLNNVEIYLDAPIIFNILGLNGTQNLNLAKELLQNIKSSGGKLKIFEINYKEVTSTIQDVIEKLIKKNYDLSKSSILLKTAVRENITSNQLQLKLNMLDNLLETHNITQDISPSLKNQSDNRFQIDEKKLATIIDDVYSKNGFFKKSFYRDNQIERDCACIANIFKIRKSQHAISLKNSKAILLTSNEVISFAAKIFERDNWQYKSNIPVCMTDVFLSTILWVNHPKANENLNIKRLMSECYSIIELDNRILSKFNEDIDRLKLEGTITNEQFYLLSASNVTYKLLEQRTLNDIEDYSDKTPREILEDIELEMRSQLDEANSINSNLDLRIKHISKIIGKSTFIAIGLILIATSIFAKISNPKFGQGASETIIFVLGLFLGIFGLLRWMEKIPTKGSIEAKVESFFYKRIKAFLHLK